MLGPSSIAQSGHLSGYPIFDETLTFPIPLAAAIPASKIVYTSSTAAHCSGAGHADQGYLCIYSANSSGVSGPPTVSSFEGGIATETTGRFGFDLEWDITDEEAFDVGTYTLTAP